MLGRRLGLADGAFDLIVALVREYGGEERGDQCRNQQAKFNHTVPPKRVRIAAVDATVGLGVRETAGVTSGHIAINKNHAEVLLTREIGRSAR
jgi:hypothetical protein